jgi:hypothetical protein
VSDPRPADEAPDNVFDLFTGQRVREQVICTPPELVAVVDHTFGRGLWYDVYPAKGSPATMAGPLPEGWDAYGLQAWPQNAFGNPPFNELKAALERAQEMFELGRNVLILEPTRTRRSWYCDAWLTCTVKAFLKPVKFVGYKNQFPENVDMTLWTHEDAQADRFIEAITPFSNLTQDQR